MKEIGEIKRIEGDSICIETPRKTLCQSCHNTSCGVGSISRAFNQRANQFWVKNSAKFTKGSQVEIEIDDSTFLKASFIMYGLPMLALVVFALVGHYLDKLLGFFEIFTIILALFGFFSSLFMIRYSLKRRNLSISTLVRLRSRSFEDKNL